MEKTNLSGPVMLLWPLWKAKEAGRGKDIDVTETSPLDVPILPFLPLEIIDRILREACEWPLGGAERQVLTAATLVSRSWLPLARRLLYHHVIVENNRAHTAGSWIPGTFVPEALLQKSHLLGFTRSLSIRKLGKSPTTLPPERSQECVRIPNFLFLLAHTPRLRYLGLSMDGLQKIGPFEPHILCWLSSLALPIEALDLNYGRFLDSPLVYDLVGIWPTIRALRVTTGYSGLPPERPSMSLRELRLPMTSSAAVIEWFLPPPPPSEQSNLRFLELDYITEEALAVFSVHGPSVSTLTLAQQPLFEFAHLFTKLEELVISGGVWTSPLPALPRTLKHIRILPLSIPNHPVSITAAVSGLSAAAIAEVFFMLPNLRVISIDETLTRQRRYLNLSKACEAHRVEILVNSAGKTMHPYHIEMDRFPRQYTFSEFFDVDNR